MPFAWPNIRDRPDGGIRPVLLGVLMRLRREHKGQSFTINALLRECTAFTSFPYSEEMILDALTALTKQYPILYNNSEGTRHGWRLAKTPQAHE